MLMANQEQRRAIHADFGRVIETVLVECGHCFKGKKTMCDHRLSDVQIRRKHYRGWTIIGVYGAKKTRCPSCKAKGL